MKHTNKVIDYSLFSTAMATVLTAAAPLASTFVNGLLCGNFLGNSAFNAVNIILPVSNLVMVLTLICNMGGSVLAAKALGEANLTEARKIFSISFASSVLIACICSLAIFLNLEAVSAYLCPDEEDVEFVEPYLEILLLYFLSLPFITTLNNFVSLEGFPKLTTRIVIISNAVNIILDLVFILALGWGIKGAAWATVIAGVINIVLYIPHFMRGRSQYRLCKLGRKDLPQFRRILIEGFGFNVFYIMTNLLILFSSALVFKNFGADGMTMYGVCLQVQSLTFCFAVGLSIAGIAQITALLSFKDNEAIRYVMKRLISATAAFYAVIMLVMSIFPESTASLFGIKESAILNECRLPFLCFSAYYMIFGIIAVYTTISFQLMGHVLAKAVFVFGLGAVVYALMLLLSLFDPEMMWLGFPAGGVIVLACAMAFGYSKYCKDRSLTKFTLVSRLPNDVRINLTIRRNGEDIPEMLELLNKFSSICEISQQNRHNIELCCSELCESVMERELPMLADCFDLTFRDDNNKFTMTIKVPGAPYCLKIDDETLTRYHSRLSELTHQEIREMILNEMPENITYRYMFGLNVTSLYWSRL